MYENEYTSYDNGQWEIQQIRAQFQLEATVFTDTCTHASWLQNFSYTMCSESEILYILVDFCLFQNKIVSWTADFEVPDIKIF